MRADPATAPVPAVRRGLTGMLLAAAVLLAALAGWPGGARTASSVLADSAAHLVTGPVGALGHDSSSRDAPDHDRWQPHTRPDAVLAWSRDRPAQPAPPPNDRGLLRAGLALALLLLTAGAATAAPGRPRDALVRISPSRDPPAAR
jgi:hypothetical protein